MKAVDLRKKVFNLIIDFESALKKMLEKKVQAKYSIKLTDPKLNYYYPNISQPKFTESSNLDLSALWGIIRADASEFCVPTSKVKGNLIEVLMLKSEFGVIIGLRNMVAHGNAIGLHDAIQFFFNLLSRCITIIKSLAKELKLDPGKTLSAKLNKTYAKIVQETEASAHEERRSMWVLNYEPAVVLPEIEIEVPNAQESSNKDKAPAEQQKEEKAEFSEVSE